MKSIPLFVLLPGLLVSHGLHAQGPQSGAQVYQETCAVCHATGVDNAPKFGDKTTWAPRILQGQAALTAEAWSGVRAMPPRGGNLSLTLDEFSRAVATMARAAGAPWKDPDAALLAEIQAEEKKRAGNLKTP
ncbi:MAG: c-type cytochrome [Burkholderiales bacterium]